MRILFPQDEEEKEEEDLPRSHAVYDDLAGVDRG